MLAGAVFLREKFSGDPRLCSVMTNCLIVLDYFRNRIIRVVMLLRMTVSVNVPRSELTLPVVKCG